MNIVVDRAFGGRWVPPEIGWGPLVPNELSTVTAQLVGSGGSPPYTIDRMFFYPEPPPNTVALVTSQTRIPNDTVTVRAALNAQPGTYTGAVRGIIRDSESETMAQAIDLPYRIEIEAEVGIQTFEQAVQALENGAGPRIWYRMEGAGPVLQNRGNIGALANLAVNRQQTFDRRWQQPGVPVDNEINGAMGAGTVGQLSSAQYRQDTADPVTGVPSQPTWSDPAATQGMLFIVLNFAGAGIGRYLGGVGRPNAALVLVTGGGDNDLPRNFGFERDDRTRGRGVSRLFYSPADGTTSLTENTDWHVIAIRRAGNARPDLFIDGMPIPDDAIFFSAFASGSQDYWFDEIGTEAAIFGRPSLTRSRGYDGLIDEWIVADGAYSDAQILTLSQLALRNQNAPPVTERVYWAGTALATDPVFEAAGVSSRPAADGVEVAQGPMAAGRWLRIAVPITVTLYRLYNQAVLGIDEITAYEISDPVAGPNNQRYRIYTVGPTTEGAVFDYQLRLRSV